VTNLIKTLFGWRFKLLIFNFMFLFTEKAVMEMK